MSTANKRIHRKEKKRKRAQTEKRRIINTATDSKTSHTEVPVPSQIQLSV